MIPFSKTQNQKNDLSNIKKALSLGKIEGGGHFSSKVNFQNGGAKYITFLQATTNDNMQNGTIIITLASGNTMAVCTSIASSYYTGHCQWGGCRLA